MKCKHIILSLIVLILISFNSTAWTPPSDADFRDYYALYNVTSATGENATFDNFFGTLIGSFSISENLDINNYTIINASNITGIDIYNSDGLIISDNTSWSQSLANTLYLSIGFTHLSNFTDDLGDRGYTVLSNFTNDIDLINSTYANNTYILQSEESNLNVNDSTYWDGETSQSDLNVNSSNYWDNLNTPSDINTGDLTNDGTYLTSASESSLNVNSSLFWDNLNSPADFSWSGDLSGTGLSPSVVDNSHNHGDDTITDVNGTKIQNMNLECSADTYFTALNFTDESATCTGISDVYLLNSGDTATGNYSFDTSTLFIDSDNNKVGMGTSIPLEVLNLNGTSDTSILVTSPSASNSSISLIEHSTGGNTSFGDVDAFGFRIRYAGVDDELKIDSGNQGTVTTRLTMKRDTGNTILNGKLDVNDISESNEFSGPHNWTDNQNYPGACSADTYVTQIDDTLTCTGISDVYLSNTGDTGTGNYNFDGKVNITGNTTINGSTFFVDVDNNMVGIGTIGPREELEVNGQILGDDRLLVRGISRKWFFSANKSVDILNIGARISSDTVDLNVMTLDINGRVGIGTTGPTSTLDAIDVYDDIVGGTNRDLFIDNTGVIGYVSSSIRYKENIQDLTDTEWIYNLRPVKYDYKDIKQGINKVGLIAEEVEAINPNIVSYNYIEENDTRQVETVNYHDLIVPLLKELQNQNDRITELENKFCESDSEFCKPEKSIRNIDYVEQPDFKQIKEKEIGEI